MNKVLSLISAVACGLASTASAAQLYSETFSTDGPVMDYVGAGMTFSTAVAGSSMPGASGGKMSLGFLANQGADSVGTVVSALGGEKGLVSLKIDITPQSYSAGSFRILASDTSDFVWAGWNLAARTWAGVRIDNTGLVLNEGGTIYPFAMTQSHTLSVFYNDSGASQSYTAPDGSSRSLADQSWSVYDGTSALAENVAKAGSGSISHVGMLIARNWSGAQTMTDIDNLIIRDDLDVYPIPEPASLGLLALSGLLFVRRRQS